jgi:drug/metabolite transporter (DMT)-like permease
MMASKTINIFHYGQLHVAVMLFGGAGLFGKLIPLSPSLLVWGRTAWAVVFLLFWMWGRGERQQKADWKIIGILGSLLAFHWVAFFQSIQLSTVAVGVLTFSTFPIFTVLLAPLFLKERIELRDLVLALIATAGVALIIPKLDFNSNYFWGVLWGIGSGASFAVLALLNKKWVEDYSANQIALFQNFGACLALTPFIFFVNWEAPAISYLYWAVLGIIFTGIAHTLFIGSLKQIKAQTVSIVAALEPVYGIFWALIFLKEVPVWRELLGGAVILIAALWAMFGKKK